MGRVRSGRSERGGEGLGRGVCVELAGDAGRKPERVGKCRKSRIFNDDNRHTASSPRPPIQCRENELRLRVKTVTWTLNIGSILAPPPFSLVLPLIVTGCLSGYLISLHAIHGILNVQKQVQYTVVSKSCIARFPKLQEETPSLFIHHIMRHCPAWHCSKYVASPVVESPGLRFTPSILISCSPAACHQRSR